MALPPKILSVLQKTGKSLQSVQTELAKLAATQARNVQRALAEAGSAAQADTLFNEWKRTAHLAHGLAEINERLTRAWAADTDASPQSARKATVSKRRKIATASIAPATSADLRGNNAKLLQFLRSKINRETHVGLTQAEMAKGAAIPLGSVAYSVGRLISMSLLEEGPSRGAFKLLQ